MDGCMQTTDFNIETLNFFMSMLKLEIFYSSFTMSRCGPIMIANVSTEVAQKVKFCKEAIFDDIFLYQFQPRGNQSSSLGIVMIEGISNSIETSLEGFADLLL